MSKHRPASASYPAPTGTARSRLLSGAALLGLATAGYAAPANVDSHLARLADQAAAAPKARNFVQPLAQQGVVDERTSAGRFNAQGHVLVHVNLDGTQRPDAVEAALRSLGVSVIARKDDYAKGILAAWLPKEKISAAAGLAGVRSLTMEHRPQARVGKATSEGASALRTNLVNNLGIKGDGITVGVISDSFDTAKLYTPAPPATTAADDVKSGDLPVVNVLEDYTGGGLGGTDEGRAMCQIVYDLAPHAKIAFATAFISEVGFANNILRLRTDANCDVIVDDVGYFDEPVFSDGLVAQAVNVAARSKTLPGKPVVYASSAGNDGNNGYRDDYRPLSDASVRKGKHGNLKLDVKDPSSPNYLDPKLTAGGWHNWNPLGGVEPVTTVSISLADYPYAIFLQWDDLFDQQHGITTGLNFLVFDADGNYLPSLSGTSDAFATQQPFQESDQTGGVTYQIAITKTAKSDKLAPAPKTTHLALYTTLDGADKLSGKYFHAAPLDVPDIYGHPAAEGAIAVAAYQFGTSLVKPYKPFLEDFTSPGPTTVYFDENSHRLATPELRAKPEVAGVDGVATTFFAQPYFDPWDFFGTSAAAPHVAAVAALVLQAAGGPGSLDYETVKEILEDTTPARDLDPLYSSGIGASSSGFVSVSAQGEAYDAGAKYLTVRYVGTGKNTVDSITFDGSKAGLVFGDPPLYVPTAVGATVGIKPGDVSFVFKPAGSYSQFTVKFAAGKFGPGASVSFAVDQNLASIARGGYSADLLGSGVTFTAKLSGAFPDTIKGSFQNYISSGYNSADGYGLVDAFNAVGYASTFKAASQKKLGTVPTPGPVKVSAVATH